MTEAPAIRDVFEVLRLKLTSIIPSLAIVITSMTNDLKWPNQTEAQKVFSKTGGRTTFFPVGFE